MRLSIIILILFGSITFGNAQTLFPDVMSCFGGSVENTSFQITWTAGEPFFETISNNDNILTQGFNQTVLVTLQNGLQEVDFFNINVYPNPSSSLLNVQLDLNLSNLTIKIFDIKGIALTELHPKNNFEQIDISHYTSGLYILNLYENDAVIRTYKIEKVN